MLNTDWVVKKRLDTNINLPFLQTVLFLGAILFLQTVQFKQLIQFIQTILALLYSADLAHLIKFLIPVT